MYQRAFGFIASFYYTLGLALRDRKRYDNALKCYDKAIAFNPDHAEAYNHRALLLRELKRYDDALASCDKAIELWHGYAKAHYTRGLILADKGDMLEAEKMFLESLELKPDYAPPLFSLTSIRKYDDTNHSDLKTIQTLLDTPDISQRDKEYLYFALGKIYDDCGRYDDAFECYRQGNQLLDAGIDYNPADVTAMTDGIINVFSKEFLAQPFSFASDSRSPVFIIGMPRSGTTLMASILSNHPSIATAGELPTMAEFALNLPKSIRKKIPYPQVVKYMTPAVATRLINEYEKRLRRDAGAAVPYVIDKQPLNFSRLGFISMLFPKARVIHCTRHPLDTGLSNYFQRFSQDYSYSFDLRNIGHFYNEYARLMEHWRKVLPLKMIEISYENMIMKTEQVARKTLDFLGLEWDERCLSPHTNPYAVETASYWQVRQPIYRQSVERWRHYEKCLAPLKEMLQLNGHPLL